MTSGRQLRCSNCGRPLSRGYLCKGCCEGYCELEGELKTCPLCNRGLWPISVERGQVEGFPIEWLTIQDHRPIGISRFDRVPRALIEIVKTKTLGAIPADIKIVLFPSKADSNDLMLRVVPKEEANRYETKELELPGEQSRYAFVSGRDNRRYFLVNSSRVSPESVPFMIRAVPLSFARMEQIAGLPTEGLATAVATVVWNYNKKFGIPYVMRGEEIESMIRVFIEKFKFQYGEYMALKESISGEELPAAKDFLEYKMELLAERARQRNAKTFLDVIEILASYAQIRTIALAASDWPGLAKSLARTVAKTRKDLARTYEAYPDIQNAISVIDTNFPLDGSNPDYANFMMTVGKTLEKGFAELEPDYVWPLGSVALLKVGGQYSKQWPKTGMAYVPGFGTLDDFIDLCLKVFRKTKVYPEVPLEAGLIALNFMMNKMQYEFDSATLRKASAAVRAFASRLDQDMKVIKRMNGRTALRFDDSALNLITVAKMAQVHGFTNMRRSLRTLTNEQVRKHRLFDIRLMLNWTDYLNTFDSTHLQAIYRNYERIEDSALFYGTTHTKVAANIVRTIFEPSKAEQFLAEAEKYSSDVISNQPVSELGYGTDLPWITMMSSQITLHLVNIFRSLIAAANSKDEQQMLELMRIANADAKAMAPLCQKGDPVVNIALRTEALYSAMMGDGDRQASLMKELGDRMLAAALTTKQVNLLEDWTASNEGLVGTYLRISRRDVDPLDLWDTVSRNYLSAQISSEIDRSMFGSKAIVLTEGDVDVSTFREFAKIVVPRTKLTFMDTRGWTNMVVYREADFAKEAGMPIVCIFDGDTDTDNKKVKKKKQILRDLDLPASRVRTLKKNSIEDYLLVPPAIARAFPGLNPDEKRIAAFIRKSSNKRDKKAVMKSLFEDFHFGRYDEETAGKIAGAMTAREMNVEIRSILKSIAEL